MKNIFFVSIQLALKSPLADSMEQFYARAGMNLGNVLFTNAVWKQLAWRQWDHGFHFDPEYVNSRYDCVVIPAANWLWEGFDFSDLAERIDLLDIPVTLIGIGAQARNEQSVPQLSESALRLMRLVSERSTLIGARGEFTAGVLRQHGIRNVQVIGCPSLFLEGAGQLKIRTGADPKRLIVAGSRYAISGRWDGEPERSQRSVYEQAFRFGLDALFQSERPELDYLLTRKHEGFTEQQLGWLRDYYGACTVEDALQFIEKQGRCYLDASQWVSAMGSYDLYVGSRLHGAIAALNAGTPAILLTHDSRTSEIAEFVDMPALLLDEGVDLSPARLYRLQSETDWSGFERRIRGARENYVSFLEANDLPHWVHTRHQARQAE